MKIVISVIGLLACLFIGTKEGSAYLLDPNCAVSGNIGKIMRGRDTDILSNPWMVLVIGSRVENCGGSLITSRMHFNYNFNLVLVTYIIILQSLF